MSWRSLLLTAVLFIGVVVCRAQSYSELKQVAADTAFRDRSKLSAELIQLRDSISRELQFIAQRIDTSSTKLPHLERATKKLKLEKTKVEEAIDNIVNATPETWKFYVRETANKTVFQTGYEFHRIKKELMTTISNHHQL